ncbi:succinyl-diaminopimelate desuccinylase [Tindallia magadiensis]|uniref:Succinyl-diaminopimelate desuccinylase n=1 Tax=Tindallia magadiensis TaxID=69895 RepID=A0A1I3AA57_9FIRM|nr:M20/M25/M40 family metallo-hydrolase [Tindallia magadiensis]SFH46964.1 succinyl-diaminopimelate desuccinylase [Tindallia magadiensis]
MRIEMKEEVSQYIHLERATEILKDMVKIYSPYFQEKQIMEYVHDWLKQRGMDAMYHRYHEKKVTNFRGINVVGRMKGQDEGPHVLLNGHLDSVEICEGWTKDPLGAEVENGKLYGVGSVDMKAGCVAIMMAVEAFVNTVEKFNGEILYTFVSDEEGPYGLGTDALLLDGITDYADVAIITEPSGTFSGNPFPCLCLGARGGWVYTVTTYGKSAHAATPERGIDAVEEAAKLMMALKETELKEDPKLGKGSIAVIDFNGGGAACSVADKASFTVFRHTVTGEDLSYLRNEVDKAAKKAGLKGTYSMKFRDAPHPENGGFHPYTVSESNPYTRAIKESIREVTGTEPTIDYFPSIGDFNYLGSRAKLPTYVFGPEGGNFHTSDEYVDLESIVKTSEVIYDYLKKILT